MNETETEATKRGGRTSLAGATFALAAIDLVIVGFVAWQRSLLALATLLLLGGILIGAVLRFATADDPALNAPPNAGAALLPISVFTGVALLYAVFLVAADFSAAETARLFNARRLGDVLSAGAEVVVALVVASAIEARGMTRTSGEPASDDAARALRELQVSGLITISVGAVSAVFALVPGLPVLSYVVAVGLMAASVLAAFTLVIMLARAR